MGINNDNELHELNDFEEKYVKFETAMLLDKAGFDYKCREFYLRDGSRWPYTYQTVLPQGEPACHAPTQAQALRWLREEHKIHVVIEYKAFFQERPRKLYYRWCPTVVVLPVETNDWRLCSERPKSATSDHFFQSGYKANHDTFEEACEESIVFILNELLRK